MAGMWLHHRRWNKVAAWAAVLAGIGVACTHEEPPPPPPDDPRPAADRAFAAHLYTAEDPAALPSRVRVLVVDEGGAAVPGADVACHGVRTRTAADGRAECDVRASDDAWPIYVRVLAGARYGQARTAGGGAEVRVEVSRPRPLVVQIRGARPITGNLTLVADNASFERTVPVEGDAVLLEDMPAARTFLRAVYEDRDGFGVDVGSGVVEPGAPAVVTLGASSYVEFTAARAGVPVPSPRIWVDRIGRSAQVVRGAALRVMLPPGEHVLVLNEPGTRARHERKFRTVAGETLDLGELALE